MEGGRNRGWVCRKRDKGGYCAGRQDESIPMRVWRVVYYSRISTTKRRKFDFQCESLKR